MITTIVLVFYSPTSQVVNYLAHLLHLLVADRLFIQSSSHPSATRVKSQLCRSPPRKSQRLRGGARFRSDYHVVTQDDLAAAKSQHLALLDLIGAIR
jgi:hypothetical protein